MTEKKKEVKRVRQHISKDAVIVPLLEEEDREVMIKEVQEHEKTLSKKIVGAGRVKHSSEAQQIQEKVTGKKCIICGADATHHIKGMPQDSYCKKCGKEHFKYLNYLEKI